MVDAFTHLRLNITAEMHRNKLLLSLILLLVLSFLGKVAVAQVQIQGTVYDRTQRNQLEGVSVMGTSGVGTATDSFGHYSIRLPFSDSIYFSYEGKPTVKFAVKDIGYTWEFDMSLQVKTNMLPTVIVRPKSYTMDSMENRRDYAKVFNFQKGDPLGVNMGPNGVGMDPNSIIEMFAFKKNRRMLQFQHRLEEQEQDRYIDHRFTKNVVKKLTGLQAAALDTFMRVYRPTYAFAVVRNDLELYQYIWEVGKYFATIWKRMHPDEVMGKPIGQ
jgi:hypothetical protein